MNRPEAILCLVRAADAASLVAYDTMAERESVERDVAAQVGVNGAENLLALAGGIVAAAHGVSTDPADYNEPPEHGEADAN